MQYITPPTDNLYKFLAIGGLAVIVIAFIVPIQAIVELEKKSIESDRPLNESLRTRISIALAASDDEPLSKDLVAKAAEAIWSNDKNVRNAYLVDWEDRIDKIDKSIFSVDAAEVRQELASEKGRIDLKTFFGLTDGQVNDPKAADHADEWIANLRREYLEDRKLDDEAMLSLRTFWLTLDYANITQQYGKWGISLGAVMAVVGFGLWWYKVQRFQDKILAADAMKPKAKNISTTIAVSPRRNYARPTISGSRRRGLPTARLVGR